MSGQYVHRAPEPHRCVPGGFMVANRVLTLGNVGDIWRCSCGRHYRLEDSWIGKRRWSHIPVQAVGVSSGIETSVGVSDTNQEQ